MEFLIYPSSISASDIAQVLKSYNVHRERFRNMSFKEKKEIGGGSSKRRQKPVKLVVSFCRKK
jgi:hypothetical protein